MAICGTHASDEMIFEGLDGAFGGVSAVNVRRGELKIDFLVGHERLEGRGGFIVEALKRRLESARRE